MDFFTEERERHQQMCKNYAECLEKYTQMISFLQYIDFPRLFQRLINLESQIAGLQERCSELLQQRNKMQNWYRHPWELLEKSQKEWTTRWDVACQLIKDLESNNDLKAIIRRNHVNVHVTTDRLRMEYHHLLEEQVESLQAQLLATQINNTTQKSSYSTESYAQRLKEHWLDFMSVHPVPNEFQAMKKHVIDSFSSWLYWIEKQDEEMKYLRDRNRQLHFELDELKSKMVSGFPISPADSAIASPVNNKKKMFRDIAVGDEFLLKISVNTQTLNPVSKDQFTQHDHMTSSFQVQTEDFKEMKDQYSQITSSCIDWWSQTEEIERKSIAIQHLNDGLNAFCQATPFLIDKEIQANLLDFNDYFLSVQSTDATSRIVNDIQDFIKKKTSK